MPKDLLETVAGRFGNEEEQKQLEIQTAYNVKNYGYSNWYDFCVAEWGTKWDVTGSVQDIDEGIVINFDSAWSPPIAAYEKLKGLGFYVEAMYYEPGVSFCGAWIDGDDDYCNIEGNSDWVDENVPAHINEAFGIADNMREWEEEYDEE